MVDESKYSEMFSDLMRLRIKDLKVICKQEGISPGYDSSRKDSLAACIVSHRRHLDIERSDGKNV